MESMMKMYSAKNVVGAYIVLKAWASMEGITIQTAIKEIERTIKQLDVDIMPEVQDVQWQLLEEISDMLYPSSNVGKGGVA